MRPETYAGGRTAPFHAAGRLRKDESGESYIRLCIVLLCLAMIFAAILYYAEQMVLVKDIRTHVKTALDSLSMKSAVLSYREENESADVAFVWNEDDFYSELQSVFSGLEKTADGYSCVGDNGALLWEITVPSVSVVGDGELYAEATYQLTLPMRVGGAAFPSIELTQTVRSTRKLK